jgi:hypothetical protein
MTAQVSEQLTYKGESLSLCSEPLTPFLANINLEFQSSSTACWRGYVGSWAIENNHLYLKRISGHLKNGERANLETIFPGFPDGVFAHWFSGELRCPKGGLLKYVHGGYASQYEEDVFIMIEKGIVISERIIKNGISEKKSPKGYNVAAFTKLPVKEIK